ncbi:MAG: rhamnulokinase [Treponema sp.]|jgi:sugar (pentulose or hexulose) kinase|nr:rhamnulokinase [Treponema sp.]
MKVLAFDLGASSGRAILGEYNNGISLAEIHRFENVPVERSGHLYWNIDALFTEIKTGIKKCAQAHSDINSISIDTWGCDFALIGANGAIVHSPLCYRDKLTEDVMDEVFEIMPKETMYNSAGIEFMRFNTIFQLYALKKWQPEIFEKADKLLFMPDLFAFLLTGKTACEYTIASTSGLLNLKTKQPDANMLNKLGIRQSLFPQVCKPGTALGTLKPELALELSVPEIKIITGAGHDTADAVIAAPLAGAESGDACYISCGTWSLLGVESFSPITSNAAFECNFTNEGGYNDTIRFLKNISGLWLLQESRRQWKKEGTNLSFAEIEAAMAKNVSPDVYLDVERGEFGSPGDLPALFSNFFAATGQRQLNDKIDLAQCIFESLALNYDYRIRQLEQITGRNFSAINVIGGGAQDTNLMQYTANAAGKKVIAGPVEATAMGNIIVQLISAGVIKSVQDARAAITGVVNYMPKDETIWSEKRRKYSALVQIS